MECCYCKECKIIGGLHGLPPPPPEGGHQTRHTKRAGVVVCNKEKDRVLLVQSKGYKWGFAKGHVEEGEKVRETAIRELLEETGIRATQFNNYINVFNLAIYYIHELENTLPPSSMILSDDPAHEITGMMWIKLSCLEILIKNKSIKINSHCKYILTSHFNICGADILDAM